MEQLTLKMTDWPDWPTGSCDDIRPGCYVLDFACYNAPQEHQWSEICDWLSKCPPLDRIETFWVDGGHLSGGVYRRQLATHHRNGARCLI